MIKRIIKITVSLLSILLFFLFAINIEAANSKTLQDYKNELNTLKNQKKTNDKLTTSAKNEIVNKRNAINSANDEITTNETLVEDAKQKIIDSEAEIKIVTEQLNDLLIYKQLTKGENVYLEYLMASTSISDLIKKSAIVEELTSYQNERLSALDTLIEENKQLQINLAEKNKELEVSITNYESKITELDDYLSDLEEIGSSVDDQIKAQEELINVYTAAGCKDSDKIDDCYYNQLVSTSGLLRPVKKARITSKYGTRTLNGVTKTHYGYDMGKNGSVLEGQNVYAAAAGRVAAVTLKSSCGGNIVYIHHNVKGVAYTTQYAHLQSVNVKAGETVTSQTVIGTVGGGKNTWSYDYCSTGAHLHYTIAKGYYLGSGAYGYSSYSKFKSNTSVMSDSSITAIKNSKGWSWTTR